MVDWAYVRWWVSFATSNILGGVSPAKDWLKHLVPVLWPKDKAKVNSEPEAELSTLRKDQDLEAMRQMLTLTRDLLTQAQEREANMAELEARLKRRDEDSAALAERLGAWEEDLRAREDAIRGAVDGFSVPERTLRGLFYDIRGEFTLPEDCR
ncbi:hypothetical protein BDV41DRAFT_577020 [Aspergillus transmontanensis]|uniref:Uncharacterized protein n=1 Tax=Aspergillus transmontanensis TaxID=1034304 RepID=A0A5N6VXV9_9EURO|nr:hypothetical protein BDV41DRAFT_577020 [Aspergillus transmontanensis]